jgi:hypothetical protein
MGFMNRHIIRTSLGDAVYFSFASFLVVWLAGWIYGLLEKTPGKLKISAIVIILLSLILIFFFIAITNIVLSEHEKIKVKFWERILGVVLFMVASAIILGILGLLFFFEF